MSVSRKRALTRTATLLLRIEEHVRKMQSEPFSIAYNHWRGEAERWCNQVETLSRHLGRKTETEVMNRVTQWRQAIAATETDE